MEKVLLLLLLLLFLLSWRAITGILAGGVGLVNVTHLEMFVDKLPDMPRLHAYRIRNSSFEPGNLTIGMYEKIWKFHRDLPPTRVYAYGTSRASATVPGPTIEALQGIPTHISWQNHLPSRHILSFDPTIPIPSAPSGIPTVVHLHGGVHPPSSDGHSLSWFTSNFSLVGPSFSSPLSSYPNLQDPGNLWYHDHALGLTRLNILAGLLGAFALRSPALESPLRLPRPPLFDRHLILFDRSFLSDGSLFINSTGNNPSIHPQWQPEYFGDAIIVNGKAWPFLRVRPRRYRFRIINASNARFYRLFFSSNSLTFLHLSSDSVYLPRPVPSRKFLLAPSEIADVIVDFADSSTQSVLLLNDAAYPFPSGDQPDQFSGKVMKFIIDPGDTKHRDPSQVPKRLLPAPPPPAPERRAAATRYIAMFEYESATGEPTHLYINGKPYDAPVTETPRSGTSEVWHVINLTDDNHPLHIHLGLFVVLEQRELVGVEKLKDCMMRINDVEKCRLKDHAKGRVDPVPAHEKGWKNVFKMQPGFVTRILVRFAMLRSEKPYPFDAAAEPGYVYHCHILDHEDNMMMRPLKLLN